MLKGRAYRRVRASARRIELYCLWISGIKPASLSERRQSFLVRREGLYVGRKSEEIVSKSGTNF